MQEVNMGLKDLLTPTDHSTEFECRNCGNDFSRELRPEETPECPECGSTDLSKI